MPCSAFSLIEFDASCFLVHLLRQHARQTLRALESPPSYPPRSSIVPLMYPDNRRQRVLRQEFIPNLDRDIVVHHCTSASARDEILRLLEDRPKAIGVAAHLTSKGGLHAMTFASPRQVLCVSIRGPTFQNLGSSAASALEQLLMGSGKVKTTLAGFSMPYLALFISRHMGIPVKGVDVTTLFSDDTRDQKSPSNLVRLRVCPNGKVDQFKIDGLWDVMKDEDLDSLCFRAWVSACIANNSVEEIKGSKKVDTSTLDPQELSCLAQLAAEVHHLRFLRPPTVQNDFVEVLHDTEGYHVQNARYKTRLRSSFRTHIEITTDTGDIVTARAVHAEGRQTRIKPKSNYSGTVQRIRVIGRQELNAAEKAFDEFLLLVTQGCSELRDSILISIIWFPELYHLNALEDASLGVQPRVVSQLNTSQQNVVNAMITDMPPVVVTHGPPGTGKTTTISAAVAHWSAGSEPVWIIAQSNVAVKNIAESLAKRNVEFRLIVSKEFHFEWHEHIYERVQHWVIRSDEIPADPLDVECMLGGSCVVLCTLSMLSNPVLEQRRLFYLVPLERLVVDEASQINVSDFMPILHRFRHNLFKICFFGDPNQLPPYGQDQVSMKSVFEIERLRRHAIFLDVQYRLPVPLGDFLSQHMYRWKLRSQHAISDLSCVRFVNVSNGEEERSGKSCINLREAYTIVRLVGSYYWNQEFVIVTPYDAQRAEIERQLKAANLPWEMVFNVDSFQGNEQAYVLVSLVRTKSPGFLTSEKRANVMLSRCKKGMVIVTNRHFLRTSGEDTLMAKLARHWEARVGEQTWVDWSSVVNRIARLPGVGAAAPRRTVVGLSVPQPGQPFSESFSLNDDKSAWSPVQATDHSYPSFNRHGFSSGPSTKRPIVVERPILDPELHFPRLPSTSISSQAARHWPKPASTNESSVTYRAYTSTTARMQAGSPEEQLLKHDSRSLNANLPAMHSSGHYENGDRWLPWIIKQRQLKQRQPVPAKPRMRKATTSETPQPRTAAKAVATVSLSSPTSIVRDVLTPAKVNLVAPSSEVKHAGKRERSSSKMKTGKAAPSEGPQVERISPRVLRIVNGTSFKPQKAQDPRVW